MDAVLSADRELGEYLLTARTSAGCSTRALGSAVVTYRTDLSSDTALTPLPQHQSTLVKVLYSSYVAVVVLEPYQGAKLPAGLGVHKYSQLVAF